MGAKMLERASLSSDTGRTEIIACATVIEEIRGSDALIARMLHGPWDGDFVVARPGETISYLDCRATGSRTG
jgi:hypothetical protein